MPTSVITVSQAPCHDTCLDVAGPNNHVANVNPVGHTDPQVWRVDCDCCGTCIRSGFKTKALALDAAKDHVRMSVDEFWFLRSNGLDEPIHI